MGSAYQGQIQHSLEREGLPYVDIYFIHIPDPKQKETLEALTKCIAKKI
ncbi:MAG: aldo/keto reductase [Deltaproteobacteria bacterium]|nr:aldo/keto reductase [Deltaproteobacteria bacterium]